jgi:hypothetical protein
MRHFYLILLVSSSFLSYSQNKKPFPTGQKVQPEEIIVREINLPDSLFQILYTKNVEEFGAKDKEEDEEENPNDTLSYWERIKGFKKVWSKTNLENYVINNNLTDKVQSVSDRIGIYNLSKITGEFLVAEIRFRYLGGYRYEVELEIKRSVSQKIVYHIKRSVTNWTGIKKPLLHTLFNDIYNWVVENKQSAEYIPLD